MAKGVTTLVSRKPLVIVLTLALVVVLGVIDYVTGREIAITSFYLGPICWASWVTGRRAGLLLALAATCAWLTADVMAGYNYSHPAIPYWNALMLLVLFAVVVYLLTAFHDAHLYLEDTVAHRTAALREEIAERKRLEASKIQAERLAVVGTMAAEVAHEVRNPLGAMVLNLDLIKTELEKLAATSGHAPDEGARLVDEMRAEVERIQQVLEDYLRFARLPKLQTRAVALNELLDQKLAFMESIFGQAGVALRTSFDPALETVNADPEQLWQAILNLIRNGIDAAPAGGEIIVSTALDGREALIRVADTGRGMTAEQLEQIYIPFFTTKPAGTGLGLALV